MIAAARPGIRENGHNPTSFSDNFNRTNAALGPPWISCLNGGATDIVINGNQAAPSSSGSGRITRSIVGVGSSDMDISATIAAYPNADDQGIMYRNISVGFNSGVGFLAFDSSGQLTHYHPVSGYSFLGSAGPGDRIRALVIGTTATVYKNTTVLESVTVPAALDGQEYGGIYFEFNNSTGRLDDFAIAGI